MINSFVSVLHYILWNIVYAYGLYDYSRIEEFVNDVAIWLCILYPRHIIIISVIYMSVPACLRALGIK